MAENTEDTIVNEMSEETKRSVIDAAKKAKASKNILKAPWAKVTIGGVSGVMLGAGGAYAAEELIQHISNAESLKVAAGVSDDQSFKEAFDTAREEVGPGGVFEWHGNVYATYNQNEWETMTDEQRDKYNDDVMAYVEGDNAQESEAADETTSDDVMVASAANHAHTPHEEHTDAEDVQIISGADTDTDDVYATIVDTDTDVYVVDIDEIAEEEVAEDAMPQDIVDDNYLASMPEDDRTIDTTSTPTDELYMA